MTSRVAVEPRLLTWARKRSGRSDEYLRKNHKHLPAWEAGEALPTFRQLEQYANATYTPIGFFFLDEPPAEVLPIPDFRTIGDETLRTPTPDLLDTIYACQGRQDWYREFASTHAEPVQLVGSLLDVSDPVVAAATLREALGFGLSDRVGYSSWSQALSGLAENAEAAGVLVMINGVVESNTHRRLNPREFRGFALVDPLAPVVFINGADTKAAQIFTLAHELVHVALSSTALSRPSIEDATDDTDVERWCNSVAAEMLVPYDSILTEYRATDDLTVELDRLARFYKVSTLVILRRLRDTERIPAGEYRALYEAELARVLDLAASTGTGGNFYNTQPVRMSKRFAKALIADTLEGRTLYTEAFRLLGFKKSSTFDELGQRLGVA